MIGFLVGAALLGIIGVVLWAVKGKKEGKSAALELTDTSDVKDVNELYESMRGSMGDGNFTHMAELKGVAHTDNALTSELSKTECVYYSSKVVHEYRERVRKTDSQGNMTKKWENRKKTVQDNKQWAMASE